MSMHRLAGNGKEGTGRHIKRHISTERLLEFHLKMFDKNKYAAQILTVFLCKTVNVFQLFFFL